jgi:hypothetical protein
MPTRLFDHKFSFYIFVRCNFSNSYLTLLPMSSDDELFSSRGYADRHAVTKLTLPRACLSDRYNTKAMIGHQFIG